MWFLCGRTTKRGGGGKPPEQKKEKKPFFYEKNYQNIIKNWRVSFAEGLTLCCSVLTIDNLILNLDFDIPCRTSP